MSREVCESDRNSYFTTQKDKNFVYKLSVCRKLRCSLSIRNFARNLTISIPHRSAPKTSQPPSHFVESCRIRSVRLLASRCSASLCSSLLSRLSRKVLVTLSRREHALTRLDAVGSRLVPADASLPRRVRDAVLNRRTALCQSGYVSAQTQSLRSLTIFACVRPTR